MSVLNAGSLPAALNKEPISEVFTGPTLGPDTIQQSTHAMIISAILVPLFMLWYYRFAGLVANIALVVNMVVLVAVMIAFKAAFTLPGLAGLALTVGMAVDNNVLLYERIAKNSIAGPLRMAIRNAFHRVGVVIIDANLTHLIAATVLFVLGTEQVKGFAITFWLGAVLSMWTSMFVARVVFDIAEKKQWLTKLKMMHVSATRTSTSWPGSPPRHLLGADYRAGAGGGLLPRQGAVRHRLHRRGVDPGRLPRAAWTWASSARPWRRPSWKTWPSPTSAIPSTPTRS